MSIYQAITSDKDDLNFRIDKFELVLLPKI